MKPYYQQQSPLDEETPFRYLGRRMATKGFLLGSLVFAIACSAFVLLGQTGKDDDLGAHAWGGSVSPYPGERQANASPSTTDNQSLFANDATLARDANNANARTMQRDTSALEQRRNNPLEGAELCARQGAWACVQRQASEALAIDPGSKRAQSLMERAIVATAWKPLAPSNALHGADEATAAVPLPRGGAKAAPLPSLRDWGQQDPVRPPTSKDWSESAPPLPGARMQANPKNLAHANSSAPAAAADQADVSRAAMPASSDNGLDPRERAILQSGWEHPVPSGTAH